MIGTGRDFDEDPLTLRRYNGLTMLGLATDVIVPYVTLSNEMATRYWGQHIGYGFFEYFNPCVTNGKMDDVELIPEMVEQADKYKKEFCQVWTEWISR